MHTARLTRLERDVIAHTMDLWPLPFVIGRDPDSTYQVNRSRIAPHHLRFEPSADGSGMFVEVLRSTFPTRVNGRGPIAAPRLLGHGDLITIEGALDLVYLERADAAAIDHALAQIARRERARNPLDELEQLLADVATSFGAYRPLSHNEREKIRRDVDDKIAEILDRRRAFKKLLGGSGR